MTADLDQTREPTIFNSLLICFFVGTALFVALIYRQDDLALLAALVLLIIGGTKIWGMSSLFRVSCIIDVNRQRVFPGEALSLTATVRNAKFLPVWVQMDWPQTYAFKSPEEKSLSPHGTSLLWHQQVKFDRNLVAMHRGCYQMGPSLIKTGDLFGFFRAKKKLNHAISIIVYPRKIMLKPVVLPRRELFGTPGDKSPVKDPVYILGTRDYQPSRPSRYIHWKSSARRNSLQEKIFEPSQQGKILIVMDVGEFEKCELDTAFERTLEIIAALALQLDGSGFAVGLLTNGKSQGGDYSVVPSGRGPQQLPAILEGLARLEMKKKDRLSHILKKVPGSLQGSTCALFCGKRKTDLHDVQAFCKTRHIDLTQFAWEMDGNAVDRHHKDTIGVHSIMSLTGPTDLTT